ncbi:MAG: SRPBCC domain-containing protein [Cyclobacteriaceae bacterium]|nr:SRPBCC domain-containing protein [Cyclobacteriaceae bacterium]
MNKRFQAKATINLNAPVSQLWDALINPEIIRQYFWGTNAVSDWKKGSPLYFRGEWEGKSYEDKGIILDIQKERMLRYTHWSSFTGEADIPENYMTITYFVSGNERKSTWEVEMDNIRSEEAAAHSVTNWNAVMASLKALLEKE